jgi:hypothetical protein
MRILLFAFIGSIFALYMSPVATHWSAASLEDATQHNLISFYVLSGLLCLVCLSLIHGFARFRLQQARWFTYPPLPVAVVIGFLLAAIWPSRAEWIAAIPHIEPSIAIIIAIGYGLYWVLSTSAVAAVHALRRHIESADDAPDTPTDSRPTLEALTDEQLSAWFAREQPISSPREDLNPVPVFLLS